MKVGAHLSASGGYTNPLRNIVDIGGNCLQIFASSPRTWGVLPVNEEQVLSFVSLKRKLQVNPVVFHASYLINLANPSRIGHASVSTLIQELTLAERMNILGTIIHLGSFNGDGNTYEVLLHNIERVLEKAPKTPYFIIENSGNRKIGQSVDEIASIINDLKDERVKVCIDTCHLFATGYDLSTYESYHRFFDTFDKTIGLDKLVVIQVNDSKDDLGSFRDRHENLGEGTIPKETFRLYCSEPETKDLPFLLEVPGNDPHHKGPDKKNIDVLKSFFSHD